MDFPGMPGYRMPHPQESQGIPPPNYTHPSMQSDQGGGGGGSGGGSGGHNMYQNPQMSRMPPGYPPVGDPHMPSNYPNNPMVAGQEQGIPMGYQGPGPMPQQPMMSGYHPHMGTPMNSRPPHNIPNFPPNSNAGSNMPPQNFSLQHRPPPTHPQPQRNAYPNHPPRQHIPDYNAPHPQHNMMQQNDFRHPMQNTRAADFHHQPQQQQQQQQQPQQQQQQQQHNSTLSDYMPPPVQNHHSSQQRPHQSHPQRPAADQSYSHHEHAPMSHHDFRHSGRDNQAMTGYMGMQSTMMNDHGMMGQMDGHMMGGGGVGYSEHHMMQMYGDPNMPEMHEGDFRPLGCQLMDKSMSSAITSMNFDAHQELLWAGNQRGYVASYYGAEFQKYSGFRVHLEEDVRTNLAFPQGVLSLTPSSLRGTLRRGLPVFSFKDPHLHDMQCMMMKGSESVLIGGHHNQVLEVDIIQNSLANVYTVKDAGVAIFRSNDRYICGGDSTGKVTIYDAKTMRAEHTLDGHSSCLSDFDIHENLLITCGFSSRMNNLAPDRLLVVYDMRVMRAMAPIQVSIDPTFLRFLPTMPNHLVVVSQMGTFQFVETITGTPTSRLTYPVETNGSYIVAFDVSQTYQAMAFGDSLGNVHLYGNSPNCVFNAYSEPTEFADPVEPLNPIEVNDELSAYSGIPMPYPAQGPLVSDFPEEMMARTYRKALPIDSEVLKSMKVYQNIGYAPNTKRGKRNVCPYDMGDKTSSNRKSSVPESPMGRGDDPFATVPKRYRRVEIKYSKLGVEDFDFRHYNKTNLAGLEPHIPNAYCNSMLQVLYYMEPLRCALLGHVCQREFCLSCELGFLFHMLDSQKGNTCQATNFLRAFRTMPQVSALGLVLHDIDENTGRVDFPRLIQSWQRFVLMQIHEETCVPIEMGDSETAAADRKSDDQKEETSGKKGRKRGGKKKKKDGKDETKDGENEVPVEQKAEEGESDNCDEADDEPQVPMTRSIIRDLLGIQTKCTLQCKCGLTGEKVVDGTHINLSYPDCRPGSPQSYPLFVSFAEVVEHSMTASTNIQTWCSACKRYLQHCQRKSIQNLPDVLALNCHTENEKNLEFWKTQFQIVRDRCQDNGVPTATIKPSQSSVKCRFGNACHRADCRFQHDGPREVDNEVKKKPVEDEDFGPSWIPMGLRVEKNPDGSVDVTEISDEEPLPLKEEENVRYYELYSVVSHVLDSSGGNLVCCLKVGEKFHQRKERVTCTQWYLINDFCITPVEKDEAVDFKLNWNVPCIIHYARRNFVSYHDLSVKNWSSPDILVNDTALLNPERRKINFMPLQEDELPKKDDLVALDAEFVALKEEEAELRSDGTRSTIIPSQMTVARITCIRGSGPKEGEPFIDDYISTHEQVVDYLTQYSGIKQGDLDPSLSMKHLTTLKSTYLKLRYLVDAGVVFVGHGLKKDFRVINLLVPKAQVMDTVELYHLPRQRYISLKFLAWYFLKINIQSYTHDSAEDARTALQLYLKYKTLREGDQEKLVSTIKDLYEDGRKISWKIPDVVGEEISEADFL